ncbi:unnamed protein product, partial [Ectocarpus sp. 8 AP-2014]
IRQERCVWGPALCGGCLASGRRQTERERERERGRSGRMATENVQEAAAAAAEKLAEAAAAAGGEASPGEDDVEEMMLSGEQDQWSFLTKAAVAVMVIIVCLIANKVIRGETPEEKRLRLRNQRRAKKKADSKNEPDEIDRLLSSIVRRQPGQAPPPGAVPI